MAKTTKKLEDLATPAFVINRHAFEENCQMMLDVVKKNSVFIRPHVKTHKTSEGCYIQATGHSYSTSSSSKKLRKDIVDTDNNISVGTTTPFVCKFTTAS
jgi:purine nucleoside phosphorylase